MVQISKRRPKAPAKHPPKSPKHAARVLEPIDDHLRPELFKALCDPTRSRILACLAKCGRPCTVSEVAECCDVDFSVVSRHLALMSRAGVLKAVRDGRSVNYQVRFAEVVAMLRHLADAFDQCSPRNCGPECCGVNRAK